MPQSRPQESAGQPPAISATPTLASPLPVPDRPDDDGRSVPGYEGVRELGRGGRGVVYQARQTRLNRVVALKVMLSGVHSGAADLARFQTEAEAVARLQHPHVVQIYEVGEHNGLPYLALEFCPGGSLEARLRDH